MDDRIQVVWKYMSPTAEYPQGSYLHKVGDQVTMATGYYAIEYPGFPSFYWHGGPPIFVVDTRDWAWEDKCESKTGK
jgi:hypothetical protein